MSKTQKIWIVVGVIIAVPILLVAGLFIVIRLSMLPLPESQRNVSYADVKVGMKISNDDRTPVIRTYYESDFLHLDKEKRTALDEVMGGRVEGELPILDDTARNQIKFTFKDKNNDTIKVDSPRAHVAFYKQQLRLPKPSQREQYLTSEADFNLSPDQDSYTLTREQMKEDLDQALKLPDFSFCVTEVTLRFSYQGKDYVAYTSIPYSK